MQHTQKNKKRGQKPRFLAPLVMASLLATGATATLGAATASASVGQNQINHVYMNLGESGSQSQQSQYQALIDSLRVAASNNGASHYRGNSYISQYADQGLIRLSLHRDNPNRSEPDEVSLWIDPTNLYVLGFTNRFNQTWQFNDNRINLAARLSASGFNTSVQTLYFGGAYPSLTASAGVTLDHFSHNYGDILGSVTQLANVTNPTGGEGNGSNQQWTARSLIVLIQMTVESARLYDINGVFRTAMIGQYATVGITAFQENIEHGWGQASAYGQTVTGNPSAPNITTSGGVTWNGWNDVASRIAILNYRTSSLPDKGNSANWRYDEL
ncbi:ribosome-inactivating family protein [Streptomyces sp. NPDC059215]|uniref:ribosome-inactivating family protein n=1 Tax=Streptomyces sp. NPDC059215 TaxID=3346772 RepID=UPI0036C5352F